MIQHILFFSLSLSLLPAGDALAQRLDVVMIMADDVGYECFGCYGSEEYQSPRLDALASGGFVWSIVIPNRSALHSPIDRVISDIHPRQRNHGSR
jgi:hypothetical protein